MKALQALIRLHKYEIDKLKKEINILESQKQQNISAVNLLYAQIEFEFKNADKSDYVFAMDQYIKHANQKRDQLNKEIQTLSKQIISLSKNLELQFTELKKFEIALKQLLKKEQLRIDKLENQALDQFNVNKFNTKSHN